MAKMLKKMVMMLMAIIVITPVLAATTGDIWIAANKDRIKQGQYVTLFTRLDVKVNDYYRVDHLSLQIHDSRNHLVENCHFRTDGSIISGCENIKSIKAIKGKKVRYWGYHYGDDELWYKIVLKTDDLEPGKYRVREYARVITRDASKWFASKKVYFNIIPKWDHKKPKKTN